MNKEKELLMKCKSKFKYWEKKEQAIFDFVFQEGRTQALEEVKEKIESILNEFENRKNRFQKVWRKSNQDRFYNSWIEDEDITNELKELLSKIDDNSHNEPEKSHTKEPSVGISGSDTKEKGLCKNCGVPEELHPHIINLVENTHDVNGNRISCKKYEEAK